MESLSLVRVTPDLWRRMRAIRLISLAESPEMFGSDVAREEAFEDAEWRRRAGRPAMFIAERSGADVGIAGVFETDGTWRVGAMWVSPDARGTGVVDAMLAACDQVVREAGAGEVHLGVMEDNPRGIRAYERAGFRLTGAREHMRDGRYEVAMTKRL